MQARKRGRPPNPNSMRQQTKFDLPLEQAEALRKSDPSAWDSALAKQEKMVERSAKQWLGMTQRGVTREYLEALEAADPELMSSPLSPEEIEQRYAEAFRKVEDAPERNQRARQSGANAMKQKHEALRDAVARDFAELVGRSATGGLSVSTAAGHILSKAKRQNYPWVDHTNDKAPSKRTLQKILRELADPNPPHK